MPSLTPPVYSEVHPDTFENVVKGVPQGFIDSDRHYDNSRTFLSDHGTSGYTIAPDGEIKYVFSTEKGHGALATQHAIAQGGTHANTFRSPVSNMLARQGFVEFHNEPNWTPGGPDVVWMHAPGQDPAALKARLFPSQDEIKKSLLERLKTLLK